MKIGKLLNTNEKGQLVIPLEYRVQFGITPKMTLNVVPHKTGIFIQPVEKVVPAVDSTDIYSKVLEQTTGAWAPSELEEIEKNEIKEKLEIEASKKRKEEW